mmetsp:Transcript_982/g.2257  ORF Transcript_982/g.2257 Transcript_982/m.2257 type:complete len:210 (+) Transcript_982:385-1014(+)
MNRSLEIQRLSLSIGISKFGSLPTCTVPYKKVLEDKNKIWKGRRDTRSPNYIHFKPTNPDHMPKLHTQSSSSNSNTSYILIDPKMLCRYNLQWFSSFEQQMLYVAELFMSTNHLRKAINCITSIVAFIPKENIQSWSSMDEAKRILATGQGLAGGGCFHKTEARSTRQTQWLQLLFQAWHIRMGGTSNLQTTVLSKQESGTVVIYIGFD